MPSVRVRAFLASAALVALPLVACSVPATATAEVAPAVVGTTAPRTPSPTPEPAGNNGKLIALVVSGAVVLGVGGGAGLYLTRHRHDR